MSENNNTGTTTSVTAEPTPCTSYTWCVVAAEHHAADLAGTSGISDGNTFHRCPTSGTDAPVEVEANIFEPAGGGAYQPSVFVEACPQELTADEARAAGQALIEAADLLDAATGRRVALEVPTQALEGFTDTELEEVRQAASEALLAHAHAIRSGGPRRAPAEIRADIDRELHALKAGARSPSGRDETEAS